MKFTQILLLAALCVSNTEAIKLLFRQHETEEPEAAGHPAPTA